MKRLQFLMADDLVIHLDALVDETGLKTRTQLLNSALTLFEWAVRERKNGRVIASVDEAADKYKEIDLPGLPPVVQEVDIDKLRALLAHADNHDRVQLAAEVLGLSGNDLSSWEASDSFQDKLKTSGQAVFFNTQPAKAETGYTKKVTPSRARTRAVSEAQGWYGDTRAMPSAIAALKDKNELVRQAAAEALGRIGDIQAVEPLKAALEDEDEFVRQAAAEALRKIGESHGSSKQDDNSL